MFNDAQNIQIQGGNFNVFQGNVHIVGNRSALDLLRDHCALSALLDSKERFDPARCSEDTREAVIEDLMAWINGDDQGATMAWLYGGAGAGKSALGQTLAELCEEKGRLAGSFFFSRTSTAERGDGDRLIPTLVFQLMQGIPALKPLVEEAINQNPGLFERSRRSQMELLLIRPLERLYPGSTASTASTPSAKPTPHAFEHPPTDPLFQARKSRRPRWFNSMFERSTATPEHHPGSASWIKSDAVDRVLKPSPSQLIVIDGLDECNDEDVQTDLLRILAGAIPRLHFPFRVLVASRPEAALMRTIDHDYSFQSLDVRRFDLGNDSDAAEDIRRFLVRGFQEIHRAHPLRSLLDPQWPQDNAISTIVQKSSSHFIYASVIMKYVQYPKGRPDKRLEVVLGLSVATKDKPFAQLDALYRYILLSADHSRLATIKSIFGIILIANGSGDFRGPSIGCSVADLEGYLSLEPGEITLMLEPLVSLVTLPLLRGRFVTILHASLFDFLNDFSRSGDLHVDISLTHEHLAMHFLRELGE